MANFFRARVLGIERLGSRMADIASKADKAARAAVEKSGRLTLTAIRQDVDRVFSGSSMTRNNHRRVSNAIRMKMYRIDRGGRFGWRAQIHSKFGAGRGADFDDFFGPYLTGKDIRPTHGKFLYIPLSGTRRLRRGWRGAFTLDATMSVIPLPGGRFLVTKMSQKRMRAGRQIGTAIALLVPRVKIRKRLKTREVALRETRDLGLTVRQFWAREKL